MRFSRDAFDTHHLRAMTERLHWHRKPSAKAVPLSARSHAQLHRVHGHETDEAEVMKVTVVSTAVALAVVLAALLAIGFGSEMARWMGLE